MASKTFTGSIIGLDAERVEVEADARPGLTRFYVVGLPDAMVQEARERVKSAVKHSGFLFPRGTAIVNLAPADLRKAGTLYDLPIAVALIGLRHPASLATQHALLAGELSLDGQLRPIHGSMSLAALAKHCGASEVIVPRANAKEASLVPGIRVYGAESLSEVVAHLEGRTRLPRTPTQILERGLIPRAFPDFSSVRGQEQAKRALEIAAAGGHNVLMQGPPGSGKTLLAHCYPSILPALEPEEILEVTRIWSVAGKLDSGKGIMSERPFRTPHHTASGASLVGGGTVPRPGEVSIAHRGVLFLDEFPEFARPVLENLRQPLEDGTVTVTRVQQSVTFPARFNLIAAMNPCPCGYATDPDHECSCTPMQIALYRKRISGPLLDRIDLLIEVPRVKTSSLLDQSDAEASAAIRERVCAARDRQMGRRGETGVLLNSELPSQVFRGPFKPHEDARKLLEQADARYHLSGRSYFRILKVALTIADLSGSAHITMEHVAEALQYRQIFE
ncbi:ATP-binding protein [Candidatus Uhrbacteria bacterium UHB]|nr:ATP-binding protein [Candidatus Uhrbacteria bacterium UHB]RIL00218.1 MAG: hypothetical protein DCC77_04660 [Candidatus Uhrbacteria bacterium]